MNLVMTLCMNYCYEIFERFVGSLLDNVNTDLIIFISKSDIVHCEKLKEKYENLNYKVVDNKNEHVVNYRFKMYYDYLKECDIKYEYIFLCDSRDVLFQKDIFTHKLLENNSDLYIFEEESGVLTVDLCRFNSMYVTRSGLDIHDIIYDKKILCVGTILGKMNGIIRYLEEFNNILYNVVEERNRVYYGTDSGVNYNIIYGNKLNDLDICVSKNKDGLVYTVAFANHLGFIDKDKLLNSRNMICKDDSEVYCVHQYDRFDDEIKKKLSVKYNFVL